MTRRIHGGLASLILIEILLASGFAAAAASSSTGSRSVLDAVPGWSDVTTASGPTPMAGAMMAYSSAANRFILFGGWDGVQGLNQTWLFDPGNRTWTELHPVVSPIPRGDEMFVYDSRSDLFVLFGGWYEYPNGSYRRLADTWTFSLRTNRWTQRNPISSPSPRSDAEVAYDPASDAVLLVGGFSGSAYLGDVWAFFPSNDSWWPHASGVVPSPRADGRMVFVASQDRFLLFGGNDYSGPNFTFHHLADTWSFQWDTNTWSMLSTTVAPPARDYPVFAIDTMLNTALLSSGFGNGTSLGDLWGFNLSSDAWSNLTPATSPPPRYAGAGGFDPVDNVFVLFSGAGKSALLGDTWFYGIPPDAGAQPPVASFLVPAVAVASLVLVVAVAWLVRSRRRRAP